MGRRSRLHHLFVPVLVMAIGHVAKWARRLPFGSGPLFLGPMINIATSKFACQFYELTLVSTAEHFVGFQCFGELCYFVPERCIAAPGRDETEICNLRKVEREQRGTFGDIGKTDAADHADIGVFFRAIEIDLRCPIYRQRPERLPVEGDFTARDRLHRSR